jgi:hypothetical protein
MSRWENVMFDLLRLDIEGRGREILVAGDASRVRNVTEGTISEKTQESLACRLKRRQ